MVVGILDAISGVTAAEILDRLRQRAEVVEA